MIRSVGRVEPAIARMEGNGVPVWRVVPSAALPHVNPFLLVEEIGPVNLPAANVRTIPPHPSRGFEQITWMLTGSTTHTRPGGAVTAVAANQVEWVTIGAGDLHKEELAAGDVRSLRIWISLPRIERRAARMILTANPARDQIQIWSAAGAPAGSFEIDLIAGSLLGARATVQPRTRSTVARLRIPADTTFVHAVDLREPSREPVTVALYALGGQADVGPAAGPMLVRARDLAILTPPAAVAGVPQFNNDEIRIRTAPGNAFDVLWMSGAPVGTAANEPLVQRGSLVMRTEEEILQAIDEYRTGRFGTLAP